MPACAGCGWTGAECRSELYRARCRTLDQRVVQRLAPLRHGEAREAPDLACQKTASSAGLNYVEASRATQQRPHLAELAGERPAPERRDVTACEIIAAPA